MRQLTIVVVNHNGSRFVGPNLESILSQSTRDFLVRWVDSGSTDGSASEVGKFSDGRIAVIRHTENVGPLWIMAEAIKEADSKYILFLNVATLLAPDCVERLLRAAESAGPTFGGSFPKILRYEAPHLPYLIGPDRVQPIGRLLEDLRAVLGSAGSEGIGKWVEAGGQSFRADGFWGLACLLRVQMLSEVGVDYMMYNYGEEEDISRRASALGYKFYYVPDTWIRYKRGAVTTASRVRPAPLKAYLSCRNELYLSIRFSTPFGSVPAVLVTTFRHLLRTVAAPQNGKWVLHSCVWMLNNIHRARIVDEARFVSGPTESETPWAIDPALNRILSITRPDVVTRAGPSNRDEG
jgi:GT2 family glycosyltransferase